jgi:hypothetical protein
MDRTVSDRPFRTQRETRDIAFQMGYEGTMRVQVEVEPLPARVRPGFATALDVHVRAGTEPLRGARCTATLRWPGGAHRWRFAGDAPARGHVRVGTIQFEVPPGTPPGELRLDVVLDGDDGVEAAASTSAEIVTG